MSKRSIVWLIIGIVLVALGIFVGLTSGWDAPVRNDELITVASFDPGEITAIRAEAGDAEIRIYSGYGEPLEVNVCGMSPKRIRVEMENGVLTVRQTEDTSLFRAFHRDGYIVLWLPDDLTGEITASTASGELSINGLGNEGLTAALATSSGDVSVYDSVFSTFSVATTSGDVYLGDLTLDGGLIANSSSGYVSLSGIRCRDASAHTSSGDISLFDVRGESVQTQSASGWQSLDDVRAAEAAFTAVSGDITLRRMDVESLSIKTASGDIWADLEGSLTDYAAEISTVSGDVEGVSPRADGERSLNLTTVSGDIEVTFENGE